MDEKEKTVSTKEFNRKAVTLNYLPPDEVTREKKRYEPRQPHFRLDSNLGNHGKCLVDKAGYISTKQQIDNFNRAGINLDAFRRNNYDNNAQGDIMDVDPTTRKNFDEFDAKELADTASVNMERAIAQAKADAEYAKSIEMASQKEAPSDSNKSPEGTAGVQ